MKIHNLIKMLIVYSFLFLMLMGCASLNPTKLYKGSTLPESSVGRIIIDYSEEHVGCVVTISKEKDGSNEILLHHFFSKPNLYSKPLKVLPGKYKIHITRNVYHIRGGINSNGMFFYNSGPADDKPCSVVEFYIGAGKTYIIKIKEKIFGYITDKDIILSGKNGIYGMPTHTGKFNLFKYGIKVIDQATMQNIISCTFESNGNIENKDAK